MPSSRKEEHGGATSAGGGARRWGRRLAAGLLGLVAAVLGLELALRLVRPGFAAPSQGDHVRYHFLAGNEEYAESYVPDPVLGWRNRPNTRRRFTRGDEEYEYRINSWGMHSSECSEVPEEGVFRIVVLGDSQAITQVSLELSHPKLTELCLEERREEGEPRYEVLNLGVAGYGFSQYLGMLERFALQHEPDLVLLQANPGNDYFNESPQFLDCLWEVPERYVLEDKKLVARKTPVELELEEPSAAHTWLYGRSALYRAYTNCMVYTYYYRRDGLLHRAARALGVEFTPPGVPLLDFAGLRARFRTPRGLNLVSEQPNEKTRELLDTVEAILRRMNRSCRRSGARFAIFANPTLRRDGFGSDRWLPGMAERMGVPYLDLNSRLPDYLEPGVNAFHHMTFAPELSDPHFDARGNALVSRIVCDWLREGDLLSAVDGAEDEEPSAGDRETRLSREE